MTFFFYYYIGINHLVHSRGNLIFPAPVKETKYHKPDSLHNKNIFSHNSGGWKSKIKVPAGLFSPEAGCLLSASFTSSFLCVRTSLMSLPLLVSLTSRTGLAVHPIASFNLTYYLFKSLISKYGHIEG